MVVLGNRMWTSWIMAVFVPSFGVGNFEMQSDFSWGGPESGLVLPTSFGTDHRDHKVLSISSKEAKSPTCGG